MTNEIGQLGVPSLEALTRDVMVHNDELPQSP
jgi:hypothetical protein